MKMLDPSDSSKRLYDRLYTLARRFWRCSPELAEDAVSDAICSAIEVGQLTYSYCRVSVRNYIFEHYRNRRTRNEDYRLPIGSEGLPQNFPEAGEPASQELHLIALESVRAIEHLSPKIRSVMYYVAQEYSASEIAKILDLPCSEVEWRIKYGRKILRQRDGYGIERKRGHHQYIGIRKRHQLWEAAIRLGEEYHYLGHFKTAAQAARAYDEKAKELLGDAAKLNFPPAYGLEINSNAQPQMG